MGEADHLVLGDWNVQCFQCGCKMKASHAVRNWQGYWVHPEHNEPRQPQDFVRAIPDNQVAPWVQPWPAVVYTYTDTYLGITDGTTLSWQLGDGLYPTTVSGVTGTAIPYTTNGYGLITFTSVPAPGWSLYASGTETMS